jgi:putative nucleotidyltransferase with HDIG domain
MSVTPDKRTELILQQLDQLPTLPTVAVRVLEMTAQPRTAAKDVVTLIESDPSLTSRILRIVHRADGGLRSDINSIERAVVFLGFEAVRNAALAVGVYETFGPESSEVGHVPRRFDRTEFWKHCIAVACMSELIAEQLKAEHGKASGVETSDAFVGGLLHDIGKVAVDAALPKSFARVIDAVEMLRCDIADVERTVIGLDHMVVGKRLAERWMLPGMFRDVIWLHGQLPKALPENCRNPKLVNVVTLADIVVRQQHLGFSGNHVFNIPVPTLLAAIGITAKQLDAATAKLVARIEPRAKALGLGESSSEDLYRQALVQANRELGRMTDQLAMKNRRLAVRAKFFEALAGFHDEMRPDAPPATVLFAIGQTATSVLDTATVAAFSFNTTKESAEVMVISSAGEVLQRGVVETEVRNQESGVRGQESEVKDQRSEVSSSPGSSLSPQPSSLSSLPHPSTLPSPESGDGPIHPAGQELEWVSATVAPRLGGSSTYWIPLRADGVCIGGVIWGATPDEPTRLSTQYNELTALAGGWSLALRTCQIREESRVLNEQLAEANRRLTSAQEEIMRARMLASVGEMAAGAAHEMNNPLAVISGRSQLLSMQLADAKEAGHARLIAEQAQRLSDIITELMDFAKPTPPKPQSCDLAELIDRALKQAKASPELADRRIEVTLSEQPRVLADLAQVSSALAEVLVNAAQATDPRSGSIEISAAFDRWGGQVVLSIADNGCGMDERTLIRAFDPFYSAKPAGRRRGMGLAKALRWVEGSGGSMRLESKPSQGTRVVIVLPADVRETPARAGEQRIA